MTNQQQEVILITGASGLIGHRICANIHEDYQLLGLDLRSPDDSLLPLDHFDTDLTEPESIRKSLAQVKEKYGNRLASVFHLAAYYDFSGEPSPLYQDLTVDGTREMLRALHDLDFEVEQFVFSSSLLVMKPKEEGKISETSEVQAEWAYPQSKLEAESVIREERGEFPYVFLRIAGVYDEECHSLPISQQMVRIYEKQMESYFFPGDDDHGQSFVHLDDVAEAFRKVVEHRQSLGQESIFLIAEPDIMSYEELQDQIGEELHGKEWPSIRIPKTFAKAGAYVKSKLASKENQPFIKPWMVDLADANYDVNITLAQTDLNWQPQHRLRKSLSKMTQFLKEKPVEFYKTNKLPVPESVSK